jgi:hypothetical protein
MNPNSPYHPFIHAGAQVGLLILFLTQFSLYQLEDIALPAALVAIVTVPVIFFRELITVLNTNTFTRTFFILLLALSICLNLFLVFHWIFSSRQLWNSHLWYPWMLTAGVDTYDTTIVNPLVFIACSAAFFSGVVLMMGRKRIFRLLGLAGIIFQAVFIVVLYFLERPSIKG